MSVATARVPSRTLSLLALSLAGVLPFVAGCATDPIGESPLVASAAPAQVLAASVACGLNQPTGLRVIDNVPLSVKSASGTGPVTLSAWQGAMSVATDPARGAVAQFTYATGMTAGRAPGQAWLDEPSLRAQNASDVYYCVWLKPSSNFAGHVSGVNKLSFLGFGKNGNQGVLMLYGSGAGALRLRFLGQGTNGIPTGQVSSSSCGGAGCSWMGTAGPSVPRNAWSMIEVVAHSGASGKTSWVQTYLNGVPAVRASGFDFIWAAANGSNPRIEKLAISPTWGGTGGTVASSFNLQMSGVVVAGK